MTEFLEITEAELEAISGGGVAVSDGKGGSIYAGNGYVIRVDSSGTKTYMGYNGKTIIG